MELAQAGCDSTSPSSLQAEFQASLGYFTVSYLRKGGGGGYQGWKVLLGFEAYLRPRLDKTIGILASELQ